MYCIKCGVALGDGEKKCPLCGTAVYHPEIKNSYGPAPYPLVKEEKKQMNRPLVMLVLTVVLAMIALQLLISNLRFSGSIFWSYFASGGIVCLYFFIFFPFWFRRPNPVVLVPVDFALGALYLWGACLLTGGEWFLPFAFPIVGCAALIVCAAITLFRYVRRGVFYILGGTLIATALFLVMIECLIYVSFALSRFVFWSLYPLIGLFCCGMLLILVGILSPLRRRLEKKLFL